MLIGIWGHSACGKTYWLKSIMDDLPTINPDIVIVFGDNSEEYHYIAQRDAWLRKENSIRWQGKREDKLRWPVSDMISSHQVWILESMRWFNGLQPELVNAYIANGCKGLGMIIPYAQPAIHQIFIQQRCESRNKQISPWWTPKNCWKEASYRLNSIDKHWQPAGIPSCAFEIDIDRYNWTAVTTYLKELLYEWQQNCTN